MHAEIWSMVKKKNKKHILISTVLFNCFIIFLSHFFLAADQVPLIEDLEQIFTRSWRESHLSEIRQYQQAVPQAFPQVPSQITPVTSAQLPWLAGLAASSCNDSVHIIECSYSLAEGLSEMFKLLIEGKLIKTNYVVIICASRNRAIDSCIVITGNIQGCISLQTRVIQRCEGFGWSSSELPHKPELWPSSNGLWCTQADTAQLSLSPANHLLPALPKAFRLTRLQTKDSELQHTQCIELSCSVQLEYYCREPFLGC